ncbi:rhodanese-like/PpiC domain-containing protein 12, chloroplastic [Rosa sericea]
MLRISHLTPIAPPAFSALRLSLTSTLNLSTPLNLHKISTCSALCRLSQTFKPTSPSTSFLSANRVLLRVMGSPGPKGSASFSAESSSGDGREILVQHLLVKEDNLKLLLDLQQRVSRGEDLSDLAAEYSICPSKEEGGMLGWVRKGQMVPEFEEAAFSASLNKVVRCKTKFGWHLLQVLSEREESVLQNIQCKELHLKMQDPSFSDEAQLIDVREPEEVAQASLSGFQVLPLRQFGSWGPDITTKFDLQKDTYVMCHHGMRSLQVAQWLQTQGFKRVFNVAGGIHEYARTVDQTIPTY